MSDAPSGLHRVANIAITTTLALAVFSLAAAMCGGVGMIAGWLDVATWQYAPVIGVCAALMLVFAGGPVYFALRKAAETQERRR